MLHFIQVNRILQGRVKFPTGGKVRERYLRRSGAIPGPTVQSGWKKDIPFPIRVLRPECFSQSAFFVE